MASMTVQLDLATKPDLRSSFSEMVALTQTGDPESEKLERSKRWHLLNHQYVFM